MYDQLIFQRLRFQQYDFTNKEARAQIYEITHSRLVSNKSTEIDLKPRSVWLGIVLFLHTAPNSETTINNDKVSNSKTHTNGTGKRVDEHDQLRPRKTLPGG